MQSQKCKRPGFCRANKLGKKPQGVDAKQGNELGLKVAHRECLAKVCSLKEQIAEHEAQAAQREKAMQTALETVKQVQLLCVSPFWGGAGEREGVGGGRDHLQLLQSDSA